MLRIGDSSAAGKQAVWIRRFLVVAALSFMSGCVATTWDQIDPEYAAFMPKTYQDWPPDAIVGVWVCQSQDRFGLPSSRLSALIRPDHTARMRADGKDAGDATWSYDGKGTWTLTPLRVTNAVVDKRVGQKWYPMTARFTGREVLLDARMNGGLWAFGRTIRNHQVFVRADDEAAVRRAIDKKY